MCAWISNWPLSGTPVSGSPDQKKSNFEIIEDWWDVEHFTFTSTAGSGGHSPGRVAALFYGPQAQIDALTSPGTGSLAYATDKGTLELYRGAVSTSGASGWGNLTADKFSRVYNVADTLTVPPTAETLINTWESTAASGMYDTLDEWASNKFTARAAGYYLVTFQASWAFTLTSYRRAVGLYKNTSLIAVSRRFGMSALCHNLCTIAALNAGDYLTLTAWQNATSSKTLNKVAVCIQRIS